MKESTKSRLFTCCEEVHTSSDIREIERNTMKFTKEAAKVVWTADDHMVYCNLPPQMIQHWSYVYELNGYLMELVCSLSIGYRVDIRPLNPLDQSYAHQQDIPTDNKQD